MNTKTKREVGTLAIGIIYKSTGCYQKRLTEGVWERDETVTEDGG